MTGEQVEEYPNHHSQAKTFHHQIGYSSENRSIEMGEQYNQANSTSANMGYSNWHGAAGINYSISEASSESELTPTSFFNRN